MHLWVFRKDIKLCKALKIMSVNRRDCWNGGETEKGFWREGRIWLESRSVSIPETAWSNRELSQTKHFWTSVWHREAELLPRPDLTAHSQCTDPEHSVSSSATTFSFVCVAQCCQIEERPPEIHHNRLYTVSQCWPVAVRKHFYIILLFQTLQNYDG